jgi:beta-lactamase class D
MRLAIFVIFFFSVSFIACSPNNVTEDQGLKKYFDEAQANGTFALFDNGQGTFTVYNLKRYRDSAYTPASTFKIINSLIGIQTGRVNDSSTVIPWDSITRPTKEWNQDLTLKQAFNYSCVPCFQELARRIGKDTMQKWLDTLGYGSSHGKAVVGKIDSFWLDNSVKVTADEQLGMMKKLYFNQLPFYNRTQEMVKRMMLREENSNYRLGYKTGWGHSENGNSIGWVVGYIEENKHPYLFVLQIESADKKFNMPHLRMDVLKKILTRYGFMEGRK